MKQLLPQFVVPAGYSFYTGTTVYTVNYLHTYRYLLNYLLTVPCVMLYDQDLEHVRKQPAAARHPAGPDCQEQWGGGQQTGGGKARQTTDSGTQGGGRETGGEADGNRVRERC